MAIHQTSKRKPRRPYWNRLKFYLEVGPRCCRLVTSRSRSFSYDWSNQSLKSVTLHAYLSSRSDSLRAYLVRVAILKTKTGNGPKLNRSTTFDRECLWLRSWASQWSLRYQMVRTVSFP